MAMDVARPSNLRQKRIRQAVYIVGVVTVIGLVTFGLGQLKPASPTVEAATLWPDTVKRGPMVRQVHGLGTLVPEDIRWIPATTQGRVERILLRPGTVVTADSVILQLTNPELDQEVQDAPRMQASARLRQPEARAAKSRRRYVESNGMQCDVM